MKKLPKYMCILLILLMSAATSPAQKGYVHTESGVRYRDLEIGSGAQVQADSIAVIHFIGWLDDNGRKGRPFYNSYKEGQTVAFKIGIDLVIPGWNIGVVGMKVGGKRRLMVPADLGYGERGSGEVIPPDADLIFEVELVDVR